MLPSFAAAFSGEEHESIAWQGNRPLGALLIHGYPGTPAEVRPLAQQLHERGWSIRAPLLPGFGQEIDTLSDRTHTEWLHAVQASYKALRQETDHAIIIGYSMGGTLALLAASEQQPDGLILFAPFWEVDHVLWKALPVLRMVLPKVKPFRIFKPDFDDPNLREGIAQFAPDADLNDPDTQEAIRDFELPISMFNQIRILGQKGYQAAPQIACPTLVIQGNQDDIVMPSKTQALISRFKTPPTYIKIDATHQLLEPENDIWSSIEANILAFANKLEEKLLSSC